MPSYTPYVAHTKRVTARMRARMHKQSFTNAILASTQAERTDLSRVADARLRELTALRADHQRTFDPIFKQKALNLLQTLPLKAAADDPHFTYTLGALRVCGYFSATQSPATFNLLNHATRHTFLLDAFSFYQLFLALEEMRHPQTAEILSIVLPRVMEVATDFTEGEARLLLDLYFKHNLLTKELSERLAGVITGSVNDLSGKDLISAVSAVPNMAFEQISRRFLEAATPRLCRTLREATEQVQLYKATYLEHAGRGAAASDAARPMLRRDADGQPPQNPDMETPTERTLRRRKEEEWRQLLIDQIYEGLSLHRELQKSITWLCWAPRPLLNELVRCALIFSEPLLADAAEQLPAALKDKATGASASSVAISANGELAAIVAERENYARDLPQVRRRSLCHCLKMLHFTSYRHLPALRLLSARIAATKDVLGIVSPLVLARELSQAVEAIAFFCATDCAPAVTAIIDDILEHIEPVTNSPALLNRFHAFSTEELKLVERVVLRVLLSCTRFLSTRSSEKAEKNALQRAPAQEEAIRAILAQATALAISPITRAYLALGLRLMHSSKAHGERGAKQVQCFIGTMHLLYVTTVILAVSSQAGAAPTAPDPAAHEVLRAILRQLVPWAQTMATMQAGEMPEEAAAEMAKALALLKEHPEIMDTPAGATTQRENKEE
ncbi:mitochondrial RNA binding protein / MRB8620 / RESC3 [Leishmania donovani]|uniref:Mitochondrial_RNA_binding_protein_putative/GeneDB:LmjF.32.3180 n=1 Tax=Leishmania donovani TaxID=5661 RepID=A0A6J8FLD7_LEIDO|nr:mitochondrial RNA binding protein / MRB8620 / RESC3 [Leishmania donovani]VDZ47711.1 mitochondrial_RNA_binding_protein_putative/GeneDB:LmjF.32.3180 [Leishmania donovani]